jgi:hypothetical protein
MQQPKNPGSPRSILEKENEKIKSILSNAREFVRTHNRLLEEQRNLVDTTIDNFLKSPSGQIDVDEKIRTVRIESAANQGEGLHGLDVVTLFFAKLSQAVNKVIYSDSKGIYEQPSDGQSPELTFKEFAKELSDFLGRECQN